MTVKIFSMKKYSFALIALVFALASAFAFKPTFDTFRFDGDTLLPNERVSPHKYVLISPSCGSTDVDLCSIIAVEGDDEEPVIDTNSQLYEDLWNNGSTTGPNFSNSDIEGKD